MEYKEIMEDILNNRKKVGVIIDALDDLRQRIGDELDDGEFDESDYHEVCSLHAKFLNHYKSLQR